MQEKGQRPTEDGDIHQLRIPRSDLLNARAQRLKRKQSLTMNAGRGKGGTKLMQQALIHWQAAYNC